MGATASYTSARINTRAKFEFAYGRVEARIRVPCGRGLLPAFWALGSNLDSRRAGRRPGEIDVMEVNGASRSPSTARCTGRAGGTPTTRSRQPPSTGSALANDFHVYGVSWSPERIAFRLDGAVYAVRTPYDLPAGSSWSFEHPFFLLFTLAVGPRWLGPPDATTPWPATMLVDWVRVRLGPATFCPVVRTPALRPRCPRRPRVGAGCTGAHAMKLIPVLLYHSVNDRAAAADRRWTVSPADFASHMNAVSTSGRVAMTVDRDRGRSCVASERSRSGPSAITFDDGFADNYERARAARRLAAYGRPSTSPPARWAAAIGSRGVQAGRARRRELRRAGRARRPPPAARRAVGCASWAPRSRQQAAAGGTRPGAASAPSPIHTEPSTGRVRDAVIDAGYRSAAAVKNALSHDRDDPFALARWTVTAGTSAARIAEVLEGETVPTAWAHDRLRTRACRVARRSRRRLGREDREGTRERLLADIARIGARSSRAGAFLADGRRGWGVEVPARAGARRGRPPGPRPGRRRCSPHACPGRRGDRHRAWRRRLDRLGRRGVPPGDPVSQRARRVPAPA